MNLNLYGRLQRRHTKHVKALVSMGTLDTVQTHGQDVGDVNPQFRIAVRCGHGSRRLLLLGGGLPQNVPANVGAKVFATHAGQLFDQWAIFGGDSALSVTPKQDGLRGNPNFKCQPMRIPGGLNSCLNGCHAAILHM